MKVCFYDILHCDQHICDIFSSSKFVRRSSHVSTRFLCFRGNYALKFIDSYGLIIQLEKLGIFRGKYDYY